MGVVYSVIEGVMQPNKGLEGKCAEANIQYMCTLKMSWGKKDILDFEFCQDSFSLLINIKVTTVKQ